MRTKIKKLAILMFVGIFVCGCGKEKDASEIKQDKEKLAVTETEDKEEKKEDIEIQIPNEEKLVADYTTMKGLILEKGSRIAFVVKNTETGYWKAVKQGIDQAIQELNENLRYEGDDKIQYTYEGPKEETAVDEQVNIVDAVVSEHPDVLCLAAIDMYSCVAQLEYAE